MSEFDDMDDEFLDEEYMEDLVDSELMSAFVKSSSKSATKLTSLIVENNRHNGERMSAEDIYQIYTDSFVVAMSAVTQIKIQ
ncbi:MAG: hypothetical protein AABY27_05965 [Pseudomonadota bacterium]